MNVKVLVSIIIFSAATMALLPIGIPFLPLPIMVFGLYEVPVVVTFLLLGLRAGLIVTAIDSLFLFAVYPGPSEPFVPAGAVLAWTAMMVGVYASSKLFGEEILKEKLSRCRRKVGLTVVFAILLRVALTTPLMYAVMKLLGMPDISILLFALPWLAVFNAIQTLITIPTSFVVVNSVGSNLKAALKANTRAAEESA